MKDLDLYATPQVGRALECYAGSWEGHEPTSYEYQWLRDGAPIPGAHSTTTSPEEHPTYTPVAADRGKVIQCEVTAINAGGATSAISTGSAPAVTPASPVAVSGPSISAPPVTVTDQLPAGLELVLAALFEGPVAGSGWTCASANSTSFACTRSDALAAGAEYPSITALVYVAPDAPDALVNTAMVEGGGAGAASASDPTAIATVPFGIQSFTTSVTESLGNPFTQAGGRPFSATTGFVFNYVPSVEVSKGSGVPTDALTTAGGSPKDIEVELPPGFLGNPLVAPRCPVAAFEAEACPLDAALGFINVSYLQGRIEAGKPQPFAGTADAEIFNLPAPVGAPALFGFVVPAANLHVVLTPSLRSDGDYGITISSPYTATPTLLGVQAATFCGNGVTNNGSFLEAKYVCNTSPPLSWTGPFLTNPTRCSGSAPLTTLRASTYVDPAEYASMTSYAGAPSAPTGGLGEPGSQGQPSALATPAGSSFVTGCSVLRFGPEVQFRPSSASEGGTSQADEPTGATFDLTVPQPEENGTDATPELKDATVTLPAGVTVDPSAADGLEACSNAQFGLGSTVEPAVPAACPAASRIATVKVVTPLLEKPLEGEVFVGEPECSPCTAADAQEGRVFRLFLQVYSPERGVLVKLAGKVSANPLTGQLQATFTDQPQLPFSELLLTFNGGPRAPLANPQSCGTFTTTTDLEPWSAPGLGGPSGTEQLAGTPDATPSSSFGVDWDGAGGACPASLPFSPSLTAGSQTPTGGASSPFSVSFGREDREQDISGITVSTPPGLLGEVSQVSRCPEAQANAGTCGPESQIGSTTVGAGPGPHPFYVSGRVYLTGPYDGQPFGLSIVVPAVAGPFNLGNVVVRASIAVNPATAALTIVSDPLPQFVDGVQLRLRRIDVEVDRPGFMRNPTSCAPQQVTATLTGAQGASTGLSSPFQAADCASLPFGPSLSASTQGKTSKADGASLNVTVRSSAGQANIAKVDLQLPQQLPSRLTTLQKACLVAQFNENPAGCPEGSVIGTARAVTPILNTPLTGPAYLVSHGGAAFPDVEFVLQGEGVTIDPRRPDRHQTRRHLLAL